MYILIVFLILPVATNQATSERPKEPLKDIRQKTTTNPPTKEVTTSVRTSSLASSTPSINSMWFYSPMHQDAVQALDSRPHQVKPKAPRSLTKLAKSFYAGFSPSFSKDYFEPFERRQRPVTLVTFRKNGIAQRNQVKISVSRSREVAELQSPYNDIGSFWRDDLDDPIKVV